MKQKILAYLEANKSDYVSGEAIANALHMTRANVWKNIQKLREDGLMIEAISRRGYKLIDSNDALSKQAIQSHLNADTLEEIVILDVVDSTNDYAKEIAKDFKNTLVIANHQTHGKGRHGKSFYSPDKQGIYMSLILKPHLSIIDTPFLTIIAALAIVEGLKEALNLEVSIKWLNDIYIHNLKLSGILTEAQITLENSAFEYVIIGMGINTHTSQISQDLEGIYTALDKYVESVDRNAIVSATINAFYKYYAMIEDSKPLIIEEYKRHNFILGQPVYLKDEMVQAIDISPEGHLIIEDASGNTRALNAEEISIRRIS